MIGPDGWLYIGSQDGKVYALHESKSGKSSQGPLSGTWYGTASLGGQEKRLRLVLAQRGNRVEGVLRLTSTLLGSLRGTLRGGKLSYTMSVSGECRADHTGEASVSPEAIDGTFDGKDCSGRPVRGEYRFTR